ncbi:MAG: methyltransferase domain-containing protein [Gemmatimonadaceae bacterium]|nr:methyltransferase domain-containing protein [Gemmatimonadaceae bacterium]MCW5826164.1 methyltransferase domain-containing protein [Gemmatimonadaceae bacterium]
MATSILDHESNNLRKWEYGNGIYQRVLGRYLDRVAWQVQQLAPRRVLDAGCGEGFVYRGLRQRGVSASVWLGVDISHGAVAYAAARSPEATWRAADLSALDLPDRCVDLVLCSQVLEHIPNPERVRDELTRVSSRWLLVSVPLEPIFRTLCALTIVAGIGQDPSHVNFWSPRAFRSFLKPVGRLASWTRTSVYQIALVDRFQR